jgi:hypothetical protein
MKISTTKNEQRMCPLCCHCKLTSLDPEIFKGECVMQGNEHKTIHPTSTCRMFTLSEGLYLEPESGRKRICPQKCGCG